MKKMLAVVAAVIVGTLALAACDPFAKAYQSDGSMPSDVAETRGEDGSRESWLASLDTPSTQSRRQFEEAVGDGYTGSYLDFLKEVGATDEEVGIQRALRSAVTVECTFDTGKTQSYILGSGVIYSLDAEKGNAYVVTNYHVLYNKNSNGREKVPHISDSIRLFTYGAEVSSREIEATYVGGAMDYDIAVLKVENCALLKEDAPAYAAEIVAADSDSVTVGERAYAIGNAKGEGMTVTAGIVSMDVDRIEVEAADETRTIELLTVRTDAAVNHGNSGGGLFNAEGECIGIVCARSEEEGDVGFGYAIHGNLAFSLVQNILDSCGKNPSLRGASVARLGITAETQDSRALYDDVTEKFYKEEKVVVSEVDAGSAAQLAGVAIGDTLLSATLTSTRAGEPYTREVAVTRLHKITNLLFEVRLGDTLELCVSRNGETITIPVEYSASGFFLTYD